MNTEKMKRAFSYLKEEALKLSLFLVLLYFLVFAILRDPSQGQAVPSPIAHKEATLASPISEEGVVEIPSLGITVPLLVVNSEDPQDFVEPLKKGVTLFPSAMPGQKGTAVILGHSAPPGWPRINYDWAFSDIQKLKQGDKVAITFENKEYVYSVTETIFLQKGQEIPAEYLSADDGHIILVSCWPPGIDNKRIGVYATIDKI